MSSIGTSKGILEIGKFALYVSIPIGLMYTLANNSENMKKLIQMVFSFLSRFYETGVFWLLNPCFHDTWGFFEVKEKKMLKKRDHSEAFSFSFIRMILILWRIFSIGLN